VADEGSQTVAVPWTRTKGSWRRLGTHPPAHQSDVQPHYLTKEHPTSYRPSSARGDPSMSHEATALLDRAAAMRRPGPYQLRAAIAAEHAPAPSWEATDWDAIARLYGALAKLVPSPVVELNRAIAIAFAVDPAAGLAHLDTIADDPRLTRSHLLSATRADLLRRLGRDAEAADAYRQAIELAPTGAERRYLERRLAARS
jgi:RNA polymerase sigma-70 factor, ECF subfamily